MTTVYPPRPVPSSVRNFVDAFTALDKALQEGEALTSNQRLTLIHSLTDVALRDLLMVHLDTCDPDLWESLGDEATQISMRAAAEAYTLAFISGIIHNSADRERILDKARCHNHHTTTSLLQLMERALVWGEVDNALKALERGVEIARNDFVSTLPRAFSNITKQLNHA